MEKQNTVEEAKLAMWDLLDKNCCKNAHQLMNSQLSLFANFNGKYFVTFKIFLRKQFLHLFCK